MSYTQWAKRNCPGHERSFPWWAHVGYFALSSCLIVVAVWGMCAYAEWVVSGLMRSYDRHVDKTIERKAE